MQLQEMVQQSRPDRLTEAKLEAKVAADASSPAHNLRSHAGRSPLSPARTQPPAIRSPQREPVQMKMVSFSVQTRTPGTRRPGTTPESYIKQAIDNGDGADLLRVSCALGFLLSADSAQAAPHEAMSYIDDAVLAATKTLRSIAADLVPAVEEALGTGEEQAGSLLDIILVNGLKALRNTRRIQRSGSLTSFLYHEVAAQEAPSMDSIARSCFCVCMWTFIREKLGDQKRPSLQVSASCESTEDFLISIRYSGRGAWRHFYPTERGVREVKADVSSSSVSFGAGNQPYTPLHLIGSLLQRFWAAALTAAVGSKRSSSTRQTSTAFCSKWLSVVLELDREKSLGLSQSAAFVSSIRAGLEQSHVADRCLPDLLALIARHAEERAEVPLSPLRSSGGSSKSKHLWATYEALSTLVAMHGGAAGGPGSGGGGMPSAAVMRAADQVVQSADSVMSRAHAALRRV